MKILNSKINLTDFFEKVRHSALLILDYDGTLAPFVKERMQAFPYPHVKERLLSLIKLKTTRTIIVSGRSLNDLDTLLNIRDLELWGSHGLERKLSSGQTTYSKMDTRLANGLKYGIKICQENLEAESIEIKPYAVAVHTREMSHSDLLGIEIIENLWKKICSNDDLEVHHFDGGLELRPKRWNKGNVIQELLKEVPKGAAIAYLGDDATDEQAFASLGNKGLKVLVRIDFRPTLADIYLRPPEELLNFLDQWMGAI